MPKTTMRKTKKLAICAVFAACSVVLLFAAAVFDVLDLTIVAVCSLLVVVVHIEIGGGYDWLLYGAAFAEQDARAFIRCVRRRLSDCKGIF